MPAFDILREITAEKSFRVTSVMGQFDIQTSKIKERFTGEIDIEGKDWNIGVIYGHSGTGKSTIAREIFGDAYIGGYKYNASSIMDDMPKSASVQDICHIFNSVGFSSPPSWLKPYSVLSTGERMRVDIARAILEEKEMIVFDEFTSVVDRTVARIGSAATAKAIRRLNKKFVAVSCHKDILEWLEPDWVLYTNDFSFFLTKNSDVRKLESRYSNVKKISGKFLGVIII